eukprot:4679_1
MEICNAKQIALCNAPYINYVGELCSFSDANCWIGPNSGTEFEDIQFDVDELSLSTAFWNNTLFIIGRNHIHSTQLTVNNTLNMAWKNITYNDNSTSITTSISSFQYKSSLYLYKFNSVNVGKSTFDLINIQLEDMDISTYNVTFQTIHDTADLDFCLVADENNVYVLGLSVMFIYNLKEGSWIKINILDYNPS